MCQTNNVFLMFIYNRNGIFESENESQ